MTYWLCMAGVLLVAYGLIVLEDKINEHER